MSEDREKKLHHEIGKYEGKRSRKPLSGRSASKNLNKGILRSEIRVTKRKGQPSGEFRSKKA